MSQILHIFYKDARRFWGEIFLSVAITAAFAWFYPNTWIGPDHIHGAMGSHSVASYNLQIMGGFLLALDFPRCPRGKTGRRPPVLAHAPL